MSMKFSRQKHHVEGQQYLQIAAAGNSYVFFGTDQLGANLDVRSLPFLRFGLFYDQPVRLDIEGSTTNAAWFVYDSLVLAANTYGSVYNLAAPRNQDGVYVLQWPYLRLRVTNTGAGATTVHRAYAVLSNYRS